MHCNGWFSPCPIQRLRHLCRFNLKAAERVNECLLQVLAGCFLWFSSLEVNQSSRFLALVSHHKLTIPFCSQQEPNWNLLASLSDTARCRFRKWFDPSLCLPVRRSVRQARSQFPFYMKDDRRLVGCRNAAVKKVSLWFTLLSLKKKNIVR